MRHLLPAQKHIAPSAHLYKLTRPIRYTLHRSLCPRSICTITRLNRVARNRHTQQPPCVRLKQLGGYADVHREHHEGKDEDEGEVEGDGDGEGGKCKCECGDLGGV